MNLLEVARELKTGSHLTAREYVETMKCAFPLDELPNLTPEDTEALLAAVSWLHDLCMLKFEFDQAEQGQRPELAGVPWLPGPSGPFVDTMLTRAPGEAPDFAPLWTFGVKDDPEDQS